MATLVVAVKGANYVGLFVQGQALCVFFNATMSPRRYGTGGNKVLPALVLTNHPNLYCCNECGEHTLTPKTICMPLEGGNLTYLALVRV